MDPAKKVLLFQINQEKTAQLQSLCDHLDIQAVTVKGSEYSSTLGQLAGIKGISGRTSSGSHTSSLLPGMGIPQQEMLVFCGISREMLDIFLAEYKKAGIAPIALKAMLTPSNIRWDVSTLYQELLKEHSMFQQ